MKIRYFISGQNDNLKNTYKSSMAEQLMNNRNSAENSRVDLF